jgi:hypothetical protein
MVSVHPALVALGSISAARLTLLSVAVVLTLAWLGAAAAIRIIRQPRHAPVGEATLDLGPEPPAVVNLLVNNFKVTPEAVPATLLDLAARRVVDLEQAAPGNYSCRLRGEAPGPEISPYEYRIVALLESRAVNGVVPTQALTTGRSDQAKRWWRGFRKEVVADSQRRGLSRDLWGLRTLGQLSLAALLPAPLFWAAFRDFSAALVYLLAAFAIMGSIASANRQRDTAAGLSAASSWLGVRSKLREDEVLPTLPPTAVATWERYMAYGAALGLAANAVRSVPMGAESDARAWSAYGGHWHQVRIRYRGIPGWGQSPIVAMLLGLLCCVIGGGLLWLLLRFGVWAPTTGLIGGGLRVARLVEVGLGIIGGLVLTVGAFLLMSGAADLKSPTEVTGEVVRLRAFGDEDHRRYYVGVDDGKSASIRAWPVPHDVFMRLDQGDVVRATVNPNLGHVRSIQALEQGARRRGTDWGEGEIGLSGLFGLGDHHPPRPDSEPRR